MITDEALGQARDLVLRFGWNAISYQILNPGIDLWFTPEGDAVVGYVASAGYRVVAGAPVCDPDRLPAVIGAFEDDTRRLGLRACYFGAQGRLLQVLEERGAASRMLLGAQPFWRPERWLEAVQGKSSLRAQISRARNKNVNVTRWTAERAHNSPELERCLHEWLSTRGLPPMRFLVETATLDRLTDRLVFVAEREDEVVGFLVASPVRLRDGWLIEQIIRGGSAPNGTAELLLDAAMRHMAEIGSAYVTLGLSPLSRRAKIPQSPLSFWVRLLLSWVRVHGQRFYNFDGLDAFKAKFQPEGWEPVYAVEAAPRISLGALYAIAGAFSGTSPVLFLGRALVRAVAQEASWFRQRLRRAVGAR